MNNNEHKKDMAKNIVIMNLTEINNVYGGGACNCICTQAGSPTQINFGIVSDYSICVSTCRQNGLEFVDCY